MRMAKVLFTSVVALASIAAAQQQQTVHRISTALNHLTVIELNEPITMAAVGSDAFEIERHENRIFLKPTKNGVSTNLFIWTEHVRSVYELESAGDVAHMDVLVTGDQSQYSASNVDDHASEIAKASSEVLNRPLLKSELVTSPESKSRKNHVNIRLEGVVRNGDAMYIRYQVTNLTAFPYRVVPPSISLVENHQNDARPGIARNTQLSPTYLARLGKLAGPSVDLLHSDVGELDVAPGATSKGVLAIPNTGNKPQLYQFVFGSDGESQIVTAAVL